MITVKKMLSKLQWLAMKNTQTSAQKRRLKTEKKIHAMIADLNKNCDLLAEKLKIKNH